MGRTREGLGQEGAHASSSMATPGYAFDLEDPRWIQHLREEGYCVVRGVASEADVEEAKRLLWVDIEAAHGAARGAPSTWGGFWLPATGLMAHLAQSAGAWCVRSRLSRRADRVDAARGEGSDHRDRW